MGINKTELQNAIIDNLVLSGRDKALATSMASNAVRLAAKMVWRMHLWSFSVKSGTLSIVAGQSSAYTVPTDAEAIGGIRRLTADDYGMKIRGESADVFDMYFPYPAQHSTNPSMIYKVEYSATTLAPIVTLFPPSDETTSAVMLYKMKYSEASLTHIPDDFEPLLMVAALYFATPAATVEGVSIRSGLYQEFMTLLNKYKMKDRLMYESVLNGYGFQPVVTFSPDSWQYVLDYTNV